MQTTHHQPMRTRRVTADGYTIRYERPARTNDRRKAIVDQMAGVR